jgi:pectate lyase
MVNRNGALIGSVIAFGIVAIAMAEGTKSPPAPPLSAVTLPTPTPTPASASASISSPTAAPSIAPAFSGAQGYGAASQGGRGGRIIPVTTLADGGPGSLRACIDASGPRVCIFRVSGLIRFTARPPQIRNPYITIAGQTAPGRGITLAHSGGAVGLTPLLIKNAQHVIVRHLRVRNDRAGINPQSEDSVTIERSRYVIVDHVSASWARDELVNGYSDNDFVTVSNSLFAYGIPPHDKCALLGSDPTLPEHFSFIGNLCAHNGDRNPDINFRPGSCVEVLNNIFFNAHSAFAEVWESFGGTPVAIAGNVFKAGPHTLRTAKGIILQSTGSTGIASIYMADNRFDGAFLPVTPGAEAVSRSVPPCPLTVQPLTANLAWDRVLATAGAWPRDSIDSKVVSDTRAGTGAFATAPGTIPQIGEGKPYPDADRDGMDDSREPLYGANPKVADAWLDGNRNGKANLDEFLDDLASRSIT